MMSDLHGLGVELQERDWNLLRGLFESRVMTQNHIASLYFSGKKPMTKQRLRRLKTAGLVLARPRRSPSEPEVLFLGSKAFRLLHKHEKLTGYPTIPVTTLEKRARVSELTLRHELAVMDVKAAMSAAIEQTSCYSLAEFSTWPILFKFDSCDSTGRLVETEPDGFIRIHESLPDGGIVEHTFFLEVDRSKESQTVLAEKAHCYGTFYREGGLAVRNGRPREEYKQFGFRVLAICMNIERRNNLAAKVLLNNPPVNTHVWLTTLAEATSDPLGRIWVRPIDYRNVTVDTAF
ncbi:MAG TPA: replication-relaxation family protein, partial [Terracidiphilus sp.]|nr:replication-relaxation family protein [Terracidiphilus sp.]